LGFFWLGFVWLGFVARASLLRDRDTCGAR